MLDIILSIFLVLIYYFIFVLPVGKTTFNPQKDSHYINTYEPDIQNNVISVSPNLSWNVPIDPALHQWSPNNERIIEVTPCHSKNDGSFVTANGIEVHKFAQKFNLHTSSLIGDSVVVDSSNQMAERVYFFECKGDIPHKLYYCPRGNVFDQNRCKAIDICEVKPQGYKYTDALDPTKYYECVSPSLPANLTNCPPGQIFNQIDACEKPEDECMFHPDNHILNFDLKKYTFCKNGISYVTHCSTNEYFNQNKCISNICKNTQNGTVPKFKNKEFWRYASSYVICNDGIASDPIKCPTGKDDLNNEIWLPKTQVYENGICVQPQLCKNVFPAGEFVPKFHYRRYMANYKYSEMLDNLHGYKCHGDYPIYSQLPPGQMISQEGQQTDVCLLSSNVKYPIIKKFDHFYDCTTGKEEKCLANENMFDYERQTCFQADDSFHTFENGFYSYKLSNLRENWFSPRKVRTKLNKVCQPPQVINLTYDVCTDKECKNMAVLALLPDTGRYLFVNDQYMCIVNHTNNTINYISYEKLNPDIKLDFWTQSFTLGNMTTCFKNRTLLKTRDHVLNSTLFPTCNKNDLEEDPFVFCPSSMTDKKVGVPTLCYPKPEFQIQTLKAGKVYDLYLQEIDFISCTEKNSKLEVLNSRMILTCDDVTKKFPNLTSSTVALLRIKPINFDIDLHKFYMPTNLPYHFLKRGIRTKNALNFENNEVKSMRNTHYIFDKYEISEGLGGFH